MILAIFGGSGRTGQHLIQQALEAGHRVVALARTPSKIRTQHPNLKVIAGDILDRACVEETLRGADAVLSALGPSSNKPEFIVSMGMAHILSAMQMHNVERIVTVTGAGVRDPNDRPKFVDRFFGLVLRLASGNVLADSQRAVDLVRGSDRAWTIVRGPMLTDQPATGNLRVGYVGDISPRLSRADLAGFMLKQVTDTTYLRKMPAISN